MRRLDTSRALSREVLERIEGYLVGRVSGGDVSRWAIEILSRDAPLERPLIEEALVALANLEHDKDEFNTPKEDIEYFRDCLTGKRRFQPAFVVRRT